ncbi:MAG: DUF1249 domain-containing protein [Gammaproteobacteria bacterium]
MAHSIGQYRTQNPMWLYEHNYATLSALFPEVISGETPSLSHELEHSSLRIQVRERNKYTLLLDVAETYPAGSVWKPMLNMRIRVYTDARLAEVVNYQGRTRFLPKYETPNPRMYQRDEKYQINCLLYDWLLYLNRYRHRQQQEVAFS